MLLRTTKTEVEQKARLYELEGKVGKKTQQYMAAMLKKLIESNKLVLNDNRVDVPETNRQTP